MNSHRIYHFVISALFCCAAFYVCAADTPSSRVPGSAWPATDGLGRVLPGQSETGPCKAGRFVGIFYFLWMGSHGTADYGPHDVSKILDKDPDALTKSSSPPWGKHGRYHFWGEPLYGYYVSHDPWVIRRHAYLLSDAGIDVLIFDSTNAVTYRNVYSTILDVFSKLKKKGEAVPQVTFMLNTQAGKTADRLYKDLYRPGRHKDLWFYWKGKPLLICDPKEAGEEVRSFFTLRRAHWPFTQVNTPYAWHWEAAYPQAYGFTDDPKVPEQVNVSVAQNLRRADGRVTNMSSGQARGRSFHNGRVDRRPGAVDYGFNAEEQWKHALSLAPPFVMVTGWNEWIAGRWSRPGSPVIFVDQYNQEYSRDIEPAKHAHQDHYYYQLVANVRRYKGVPPLPAPSPPKTMPLAGDFTAWKSVAPLYRDHVDEVLPRDFRGAGDTHYTNRTGRNDFVALKVARDARFVYFYAQTAEAVTAQTGDAWMMLLIDRDRNANTGWQGYDMIINRSVIDARTTWLEINAEGWTWTKHEKVRFAVRGNELCIACPRSVFRTEGRGISFDFKWVDNMQRKGDVMDLYVSGDCAPEGRFRYSYRAP